MCKITFTQNSFRVGQSEAWKPTSCKQIQTYKDQKCDRFEHVKWNKFFLNECYHEYLTLLQCLVSHNLIIVINLVAPAISRSYQQEAPVYCKTNEQRELRNSFPSECTLFVPLDEEQVPFSHRIRNDSSESSMLV